jgi:hypothetical protein
MQQLMQQLHVTATLLVKCVMQRCSTGQHLHVSCFVQRAQAVLQMPQLAGCSTAPQQLMLAPKTCGSLLQ